MKDILLITPPFTQLNTPYPATSYLKGFLNTKGISSFQMDLGIEVILELFSSKSFATLFEIADKEDRIESDNCQRIFSLKNDYLKTLDDIILFLQGKNQTFARQICTDDFLPRASRFQDLDDMDWAFGTMGMQDLAKHLSTLYLEDLSDFIIECIDPNFGFSRYAERLGRSANDFNELYDSLHQKTTLIDDITLQILEERIQCYHPKMVAFSVPFPGNLYSAFRCAQYLKQNYPEIKMAMGGGFSNTELRSLTDVRVFEFFDFITLDDGELPLELLLDGTEDYKRTFVLQNNEVKYINNVAKPDYNQSEVGTPDYSDLPLDSYVSVIEITNPMHSLWSDGRWNKLTMAHGCYWGKCTFCDGSLDYIKNYEPNAAKLLVDRVEELIAQTGERGFHFVDEAAPPLLMKALALEILKRGLMVTWWTNVRFEKNFTQDLCLLLKASGCIAVSGGLEVASDRLLKLIDKGVDVAQVARVTRNFTHAHIMVHSYLMYGFPSETVQETVDSLEMVRQLFEEGIVQSGFWHQFALTAHSRVGLNPEKYGIVPDYKEITFANNDIAFTDKTRINHGVFSYGLKQSLFNYMHGAGFDLPLQQWFDFKIPHTQITPDFIYKSIHQETEVKVKASAKLIWLGTLPWVEDMSKAKKGKAYSSLRLTFHTREDVHQIILDKEIGEWLMEKWEAMSPFNDTLISFDHFRKNYESQFGDFEKFWLSKQANTLKELGLLVI